VQRGVTLPELKDLLGHATLAMVMRFAHLAPEHLRAAVSRPDDVLLRRARRKSGRTVGDVARLEVVASEDAFVIGVFSGAGGGS
jgi:hypothetical protein